MKRTTSRIFGIFGVSICVLALTGCPKAATTPPTAAGNTVASDDPCRGVSCPGNKEQHSCKWGRCVPIWVAKDAGAYRDDNQRFYAVGLIANVDNEGLGRISAKRRCQVELASILQTWVENVHKQYLRATTSGKRGSTEQDIVDTAKLIVARHIRGTRHMDYYSNEYKQIYASLCAFDFQAAMKMYTQSKKLGQAERDWVRRNAAIAHEEHKNTIQNYLKNKQDRP